MTAVAASEETGITFENVVRVYCGLREAAVFTDAYTLQYSRNAVAGQPIVAVYCGDDFIWPDPWTDVWDEGTAVSWENVWRDKWSVQPAPPGVEEV